MMGNKNNRVFNVYLPYLLALLVGIALGGLFWPSDVADLSTEMDSADTEATMYTCSMHPDVQYPNGGSCPLCGMELVAAVKEASIMQGQFKMKEDAVALANIMTEEVHLSGPPDHSLMLSGTIRPNEKTNSIQTTLFDGRIDRLDVNFVGETVRKGQEIGLIYSPELYLAQDQLLTSSSYKDTHVKLYKASRSGSGLWKMTDEQIDEVLRKREPMFHFPLKADVSGTVTKIIARVGNYYKQGDPLYTLSDLRTVWAVFDAYEDQLDLLSVGQEVEITSQANKGRVRKAKISFIEPVLDPVRRTVAVRVDLSNGEGLLKPGMFVNAEVSVGDGPEGIWIPKSAVLWTGKRSLVYIQDPSDISLFTGREITLGATMGGSYEVLEGLQPGEKIVVNGTFTIDAAAQLNGFHSMMRPQSRPMGHIQDGTKGNMGMGIFDKELLPQIVPLYLDLKEARVRSDVENVSRASNQLIDILESGSRQDVDTSDQAAIDGLRSLLKAIANRWDIEEQRKHFKPLSQKLIDMVRETEDLATTLYVQFCPMADGNNGAFWISEEQEIANPYFGDKMLQCGEVKETFN